MGIDTFSEVQKNNLAYLAFQCPLKGGRAVYLSRALYAMIKDTLYDDTQMCIAEGYEMYKKEQEAAFKIDTASKLKIRLYPNPANNEVFLIAENFDNTNALIRLSDAVGRGVLEQRVKLSNRGAIVKLAGIAKGVYIVNVETGSGMPVFETKLIIVK